MNRDCPDCKVKRDLIDQILLCPICHKWEPANAAPAPAPADDDVVQAPAEPEGASP